jgi:hypothetical protein
VHSRVLIDNDVLLKVSAWRLDEALLTAMTSGACRPGMLGAARFVVRKRLARRGLVNPDAAAAAFERLCAGMVLLEPEPAELAAAAALEEAALRAGLELDAGESQLTAMLIARNARLLLTGDKRAMTALAALQPAEIGRRVASLEQLVRLFAQLLGIDVLRAAVCGERQADTSMAVCFGCHRSDYPPSEIEVGLSSYDGDLARDAGAILVADAELLAIAA